MTDFQIEQLARSGLPALRKLCGFPPNEIHWLFDTFCHGRLVDIVVDIFYNLNKPDADMALRMGMPLATLNMIVREMRRLMETL